MRGVGSKTDGGFAQVVMNADGLARDEMPTIRVRVGAARIALEIGEDEDWIDEIASEDGTRRRVDPRFIA